MKMHPKSSRKLVSMPVPKLVELFEQISLAEGEAVENFDTPRANRLIMRRRALLSEMRHRPGDSRAALFALYSHPHPRVRLNVATSTYALDPEQAQAVMQSVKQSRLHPWAAHAGLSLTFLEDGTSKLPIDPE